jgi:hypothetical protein
MIPGNELKLIDAANYIVPHVAPDGQRVLEGSCFLHKDLSSRLPALLRDSGVNWQYAEDCLIW